MTLTCCLASFIMVTHLVQKLWHVDPGWPNPMDTSMKTFQLSNHSTDCNFIQLIQFLSSFSFRIYFAYHCHPHRSQVMDKPWTNSKPYGSLRGHTITLQLSDLRPHAIYQSIALIKIYNLRHCTPVPPKWFTFQIMVIRITIGSHCRHGYPMHQLVHGLPT